MYQTVDKVLEVAQQKIMRQIFSATCYVHNRQIRHHLKLDTTESEVRRLNNILLEKIEDHINITLKAALN